MRVALLTGSLVVCCAATVSAQRRWPMDLFAGQINILHPPAAPTCRRNTPQLTSDSIGPLRPGMPLRDLLRRCPRVTFGWHLEEGNAEPAVAVRLGRIVAEAILEDTIPPKDRIYRILVADSALRTADGIGPGSHVLDAPRAWGTPHFGAAECSLYVWFDRVAHVSWIAEFPRDWDCTMLDRFATDSTNRRIPSQLRLGLAILGR